ncbi:MAG: hypothetical protein WD715_09975 [Dongiaceae bacterium]
MMKIDPARTDLAREYKEHPFGPHSTDLRRLLVIFRDGSARKKLMIATYGDGYCLAQVGPRRGDPIRYDGDRVFAHLGDALWAVFQARWEQATGNKPAVD